ncbi:PAS domain S-box protein [Aneurinibacillus sp. Ricciae_BoGa-3]|uniref:PAS domain S-box protein n=1 Tax=Aneurinibacillus sp. Ricciae_BoGa-3 TaxID=3022697 RepID=UPI00234148F8|nr:PAS domain S-box protein [Aneurinibacillus sp. Ricciae_BoGa-3]WCK55455.1 PAS domain S-box protein [Aneurinibacillus sp. Ricciae_BoGa-3]
MKNLLLSKEDLLNAIVNSMVESIVLLDHNLNVCYMNNSAEKMFLLEGIDYEGKHFFEDLNAWDIPIESEKSLPEEVFETGISQSGIIRNTSTGKRLSVNATPLNDNGKKKGVLLSIQDVTEIMEKERELDLAFALTLPNSKVEYKLKSTVEYQDQYDPKTKLITITGVIQNGLYRHVVNCLRLLSNLHIQGITKIIGIDKDQLVQAFIFHDLGKSQPVLSIGDVVDPKKVFEDGKLHAFRSAELAQNFYSQHNDVVEIIRYHHHSESELPETFPWRLLPMFRLFQLVDGLSAAITRGGVDVNFIVQECLIIVTEINDRPQYNGTWQIDLYTGKRNKVSE